MIIELRNITKTFDDVVALNKNADDAASKSTLLPGRPDQVCDIAGV